MLEFVSDELKNDRDTVLSNVSNYDTALEFASHELQNDYEIALAAIKNNGLALKSD